MDLEDSKLLFLSADYADEIGVVMIHCLGSRSIVDIRYLNNNYGNVGLIFAQKITLISWHFGVQIEAVTQAPFANFLQYLTIKCTFIWRSKQPRGGCFYERKRKNVSKMERAEVQSTNSNWSIVFRYCSSSSKADFAKMAPRRPAH